jgi:molecular chaperone GrpE
MSKKENSNEEVSLEEAIAGIAEEQPEAGQGDVPDHAELTALLEDARGKADEHWDQCMRLQADIENQRKRGERDLAHAHKYALERFAAELLPVKDSLEMGLAAFDGENAEIAKLKEGVELTLQMLGGVLGKFEIREVNPQDEPFNPEFHQAMSMQPRDDVAPNTVVTVVQKGYLLHDRLVRPAMVIVSQAPATGA